VLEVVERSHGPALDRQVHPAPGFHDRSERPHPLADVVTGGAGEVVHDHAVDLTPPHAVEHGVPGEATVGKAELGGAQQI